MHYFSHLLFFLFRFHHANTLTFSEPSSLLSNTTHTSLSNLTASFLWPPVILQCDAPNSALPLDEDDCFTALQRLPSHSETTWFHKGGGSVLYKLPLIVSRAHCEIKIDLIDDITEEESSWDDVYIGAVSLLMECVESRGGLGGNALVGNNFLIQVTVEYIDEAAGRSSNNDNILSSRTPSSSSSPLSASVLHCYPPGAGFAPNLADCLLALNQMVEDPERYMFHKGGTDDGYRLPDRFDYRTCDIYVDMVADVQEEISSWLRVARDTQLLIFRCVQAGPHLGGYIFLGERDHIRVTVDYIFQAVGGNNNSATIPSDLERPIDR